MVTNCPFCESESESCCFATDGGYRAVYNLSPILPGHSLVVPVKHVTSLFDLNEEEISAFFSFARKVTSFLCEVYESDAYDWSLQEGTEAGQSIGHLHLHIIPRKPGDLPEGEEWFAKLQQSHDPANKERIRLDDAGHREISLRLRNLWV